MTAKVQIHNTVQTIHLHSGLPHHLAITTTTWAWAHPSTPHIKDLGPTTSAHPNEESSFQRESDDGQHWGLSVGFKVKKLCAIAQNTGWPPMGSKQLTHKKPGSWLSQSEIQGLRELGSVCYMISSNNINRRLSRCFNYVMPLWSAVDYYHQQLSIRQKAWNTPSIVTDWNQRFDQNQ